MSVAPPFDLERAVEEEVDALMAVSAVEPSLDEPEDLEELPGEPAVPAEDLLFMGGMARAIDRGLVWMKNFFLRGALRLTWRGATGKKMTKAQRRAIKEAMEAPCLEVRNQEVPREVHRDIHHVRPVIRELDDIPDPPVSTPEMAESSEASFLERVSPLLTPAQQAWAAAGEITEPIFTARQQERMRERARERAREIITSSSSSESSESSEDSSVSSSSSDRSSMETMSSISTADDELEVPQEITREITRDDILGTIEDMSPEDLLSYGLLRVSDIMGDDEGLDEDLEVDPVDEF
jgi:hypothetical protein